MSARLLVTGSRDWSDEKSVDTALEDAWRDLSVGGKRLVTLVSGNCPTGADAIAERIWEAHGFPIERHPADWETHGKAAGPLRNRQMVDLGADLCLAFPLPSSRGTQNCMSLARAAGIPVRVCKES